jgi:hypothetical protein
MSLLVVDAMDDATRWPGFAADGTTPSTQLGMVDETTRFRFGADKKSGKITATASALNHLLRRSFTTPVNLTAFDELRMWVFGDRVAGGGDGTTFYLELRLASAALPLTDPANTWQRYLPVAQAGAWALARFSLADLPSSIKGAVNRIQLRCVDASAPFTVYLDDLLAVHEELIADVEAGLLARLDKKVTIGGTLVPAVVVSADIKPPSTGPYVRITPVDIRYADERMTPGETRTDFSSTGYLLRPPAVPFELLYRIDVFSDVRSTQTRLIELILLELGGHTELLFNDVPVPVQSVVVNPVDQVGGMRTDRVALHYRILARQDVGPPRPVRAVSTLIVEANHRA